MSQDLPTHQERVGPSHPSTPVAVIGASGYTGAELIRLIDMHPQLSLEAVYAHSNAGRPLGDVFPSFTHLGLTLRSFDVKEVAEIAQVAFLALPHGTSQNAAHALRNQGVRVIDLSADHRFDDPSLYEQVYGSPHAFPARLKEAVYGLPELHRERLKDALFVACPGCYPTSVVLATMPAITDQLLSSYEVIADCKSGVSGAGRSASVTSLFSERGESIQGYKTLAHRHAPEMEMSIRHLLSDSSVHPKVHFAPHLIPMSRGILSTVYLRLKPNVTEDDVRQAYLRHYKDEPFVTLLASGQNPTTLAVRGSNRCHLGLTVSAGLLVVHAAIDNLGKGAASQALQCCNLMLGLPEELGVSHTGVYP